MMGFLAEKDSISPEDLRLSVAYGSVVASFNVEGFGLERMLKVTREEIELRMKEYRQMLSF